MVVFFETVAATNQMHSAPGYLSNTTPIVDGQYGLAHWIFRVRDDLGPIVHAVSSDGLTVRN